MDDVIAGDDRVLIRWGGKGTQSGTTFLGVETSGEPVEWNGMNAFRFQCGRIMESWSETNGLSALRQIGGIE